MPVGEAYRTENVQRQYGNNDKEQIPCSWFRCIRKIFIKIITVNASFYVFPSFKFSVILNLVKDNLYTFVYNYFQTLKGNNYYGKREKRYFTDRLYA